MRLVEGDYSKTTVGLASEIEKVINQGVGDCVHDFTEIPMGEHGKGFEPLGKIYCLFREHTVCIKCGYEQITVSPPVFI